MPKTMNLRSRCSRCECVVELSFVPWAGAGPATAAEWACPECQAANQMPAIGQVILVQAKTDAAARPEAAVKGSAH